jgi:hypothetical protein
MCGQKNNQSENTAITNKPVHRPFGMKPRPQVRPTILWNMIPEPAGVNLAGFARDGYMNPPIATAGDRLTGRPLAQRAFAERQSVESVFIKAELDNFSEYDTALDDEGKGDGSDEDGFLLMPCIVKTERGHELSDDCEHDGKDSRSHDAHCSGEETDLCTADKGEQLVSGIPPTVVGCSSWCV